MEGAAKLEDTALESAAKNNAESTAKEDKAGRFGRIHRKTAETEIKVELALDGTGQAEISTGIGFFDHMLAQLARHGFFDLTVLAKGDLAVDGHHTVEDVGICLGKAFADALGERAGIRRYATAWIPMDDALVMASLDISGRPYLAFTAEFPQTRVGDFEAALVEEFFRGFVQQGGLTLHLRLYAGRNTHHMIEALFKAVARALDEASALDPRLGGVIPSTKGSLTETEPPVFQAIPSATVRG